jgi:membrane protein DedA with SNARE-associated domain
MILTIAASHNLLSRLSHVWGYVSLGATSIVAEEAAPVLAGFAAHQGHLHLLRALIACAAGSWIADVVLYALGRTRAASAVSRWRWLASPTERLLDVVRRHPWRASVATRFAYGARLVLPITCGVARVGPATYLAGSFTSAIVWSSLFIGVGWAFGQTAVEVIGHIHRHEDLIALVLVLAVSVGVWFVTRRNAKRVAEEIGGVDGSDAVLPGRSVDQ